MTFQSIQKFSKIPILSDFFFNDIISIKYDIPLVELHGSTFKLIQNGHLTM